MSWTRPLFAPIGPGLRTEARGRSPPGGCRGTPARSPYPIAAIAAIFQIPIFTSSGVQQHALIPGKTADRIPGPLNKDAIGEVLCDCYVFC
ncbi:MAG TPA: hypothetical protein ENN52_05770 [Methanofollis liminatans]|uniref:Uncharacterized protein n=1 Tax=Methanofollis liminatans TaxID=2201 RepID=A0A831PLT5_9EURY|nr:hypothetical protein [Methanofollis liminatans]